MDLMAGGIAGAKSLQTQVGDSTVSIIVLCQRKSG